MKNVAKIRNMSDRELSNFIKDLVNEECDACPARESCVEFNDKSCTEEIEDWLKQPIKIRKVTLRKIKKGGD